MSHPAIQAGRTAVITGAASGIGLACAKRLASLGLRVCLADLPGEALDAAGREVAQHAAPDAVMTAGVDVADRAALDRGDFYILCPDGETTPEMDRKRIVRSALDVVDNRPALSRWHPEHAGAYGSFEPPA